MNIREINATSILTASKLPAVDYCINPYVGCTHQCLYCYARFMRRFTKHEEPWGQFVDVRMNAPARLEKQVKNKKAGTVLLGSVTDAYQPVEHKYRITRQLLHVLQKSRLPVSILTKSDLILRDIDILAVLPKVEAGLTITSLDDKFSKIIEPGASTASRRIRALEALRAAGIKTYAFIGPILPEITPVEAILERVAPHVDFVMCEALNTRGGHWPVLAETLENQLGLDAGKLKKIVQTNGFWDDLEMRITASCLKHGVRFSGLFRHDHPQKSTVPE